MSLSSSVSPPVSARTLRPAWCLSTGAGLRGLVAARENGVLLAWDERGGLYLVNRRGDRQAHRPLSTAVTSACAADDGSAYAAVGASGEVWWLAADLTPRWQRAVSRPAVAAALDPFGQYLAVADAGGRLHVFDRLGRRTSTTECQRPLHHLAFVPAAPFLVGCADFGLVACFDLAGKCVWRVGLVSHAGSLAVSGDGGVILAACFSEGLQRYDLAGRSQGRWNVGEPCRLAALTFDGTWALTAGLGHRLLLLDRTGRVHARHELEQPAVGLTLGPLGEAAYVALADGRVIGLEIVEARSP